MDEQLGYYIENMEWQMGKLLDGVRELDAEQMTWTPPGVNNPLSWLIRHSADVLWECYGIASSVKVPANLRESGIPEGWLKNLTFDENAPAPGVTGRERAAYMEEAWSALKAYLVEHFPDWQSAKVVRPPDQIKTMWWMLLHVQLDISYHTGQASYLKMLLAVESSR
jgi:hypothetical protein